MPARSDIAVLVAVAALVVVSDQITKSAVFAALGPHSSQSRIDTIRGWLAIEYVENRGAAFGLFAAVSSYLPLIAIALVTALLVHYRSEASPPLAETLSIGAVCGGAIGNLIDRLRLGHVIDFIAIGPWPNFNLADSAVTLGVLALVWTWVRQPGRHESPRTR